MKNTYKLLFDLIGAKGCDALDKASTDETIIRGLAIPAAVIGWLDAKVSTMTGDKSKIVMPGTRDKFIMLNKSNGAYKAEIVSNGKAERSFTFKGQDSAFNSLVDYVCQHNGVVPELHKAEPSEALAKSIANLIESLLKADSAEAPSKAGKINKPDRETKQKDMEEDHKVHDSRTPEEWWEARIKSSGKGKDKSLIKPAATQAELNQFESHRLTQPFVKEEKKPAKADDSKRPKPCKDCGTVIAHDRPAPYTNTCDACVKETKKAEPLSKPYASDAQRKLFHAKENRGEISHATVAHWDKESKGKKLPEHVKKASLAPNMVKPPMGPKGPGSAPAAAMPPSVQKPPMAKPSMQKPAMAKGALAPGGAGMQKPPMAPKAPVGPSKNPMAAAAKQSLGSAMGKQPMPKAPKMAMPKAQPKPTMAMKSEKYFSIKLEKSEALSPCEHCKKSQFDAQGNFNPCLCFQVEKSETSPFVTLKKSDAGNELVFRPDADPEQVKAFLLTLKLSLMAKKMNK